MLPLLASAIPKTVEEIGAIAGFVSLALVLVLFGLYIYRAIELRRLRKSMPFLADPSAENGRPPDAG